jgi:hypothetical protein
MTLMKIIVLVSVVASMNAMAQNNNVAPLSGTIVGNGSNSARDQYIENLRREMGPRMSDRGASVPDLTAWCGRATNILRRELERAKNFTYRNNLVAASQILDDAMLVVGQAMTVDPDRGGPLTKLLVDRGIMMSAALDNVYRTGNRFELVSKLNFLFEYVQFIVKMERDLDRTYYIPYRYKHRRHCRDGECGENFDFAEFQRQLVEYARQQLEFTQRTFTEIARDNGYSRFLPIGSANGFLKIAELASAYVAHDLRNNLRAYANSCVVGRLEVLSNALLNYNDFGDRTYFMSEPQAVDSTARTLIRISNQLYRSNETNSVWCD